MGSQDQPIGMFDSGVGGLTVFAELARLLPGEDIIYLGDTARVPYGTRSARTIIRYSLENTRFLIDQGVKVLVVACNTSSSVSLPVLARHHGIPVLGVIEPGARRAVSITQNKRIGVIGTEGTIKSGAYQRAIQALDPCVYVFSHACPLFVPLAEEGWTDGPVIRLTAQRYLAPLAKENIDTLVMGCTHYPILKGPIMECVGSHVQLVNSAEETAKDVASILEKRNITCARSSGGAYRFFVTDNAERFRKVAAHFLGTQPAQVDEIGA